ncbi:MAG: deoxyribonuclease IV [Deltaproteobacteria bacterium]|jgi:deoxyribonuclease-4|nr:deoxyribonuclease IV [Deltaproteobacteria bacterium]
MYLGCHLSSANGYLAMGQKALELGADTFQYFTRNPRGGSVKPLDLKDLSDLVDFLTKHRFGPIVAHAPYTINPSSVVEKTRNFAKLALTEDLERLQRFPGALYNLHPGSHVGLGASEAIDNTANLLNEILTPETKTPVLLETMAGKGSEIGRDFGELALLISKIKLNDQIGVCLDSCHVHDGGYDIKDRLDQVLETFDREIGLNRLKAVHINDSLNPQASHKDRHAKIGQGHIGLEAIAKLVWHPKLQNLPFILETPNELDGYKLEIETLRSLEPKKKKGSKK